MKIKVQQLDEKTRSTLALICNLYAADMQKIDAEVTEKYSKLAIQIRHGELLLCEYVDNHEEE